MELKHYGVLGMKWGVRRYVDRKSGKLTKYGIERLKEAGREMEKKNKSSNNKMTDKAVFGTLKKKYLFEDVPNHETVTYLLDKYGNVAMVSLDSKNQAVVTGKKWCDQNLHRFYRKPGRIQKTYISNWN